MYSWLANIGQKEPRRRTTVNSATRQRLGHRCCCRSASGKKDACLNLCATHRVTLTTFVCSTSGIAQVSPTTCTPCNHRRVFASPPPGGWAAPPPFVPGPFFQTDSRGIFFFHLEHQAASSFLPPCDRPRRRVLTQSTGYNLRATATPCNTFRRARLTTIPASSCRSPRRDSTLMLRGRTPSIRGANAPSCWFSQHAVLYVTKRNVWCAWLALPHVPARSPPRVGRGARR